MRWTLWKAVRSGCSSANDGWAMIVKAYNDTSGALICIQLTVAEIFSLRKTRIKLIGKKKKFKVKEI